MSCEMLFLKKNPEMGFFFYEERTDHAALRHGSLVRGRCVLRRGEQDFFWNEKMRYFFTKITEKQCFKAFIVKYWSYERWKINAKKRGGEQGGGKNSLVLERKF